MHCSAASCGRAAQPIGLTSDSIRVAVVVACLKSSPSSAVWTALNGEGFGRLAELHSRRKTAAVYGVIGNCFHFPTMSRSSHLLKAIRLCMTLREQQATAGFQGYA